MAPSAAPALLHASFIDREVPLRRCSTSAFVRPCDESECDDDLIIVEEDNLAALSRGTDMTPNEAWADAVAAMGPDRARMFSSDADVEPVPGLGLGLGVD